MKTYMLYTNTHGELFIDADTLYEAKEKYAREAGYGSYNEMLINTDEEIQNLATI